VDDIKMDVGEILYEDLNWIQVTQVGDDWRALLNSAVNVQVAQKARNFLTY
jgi:hypothetical protein